ncbi:NAD(+) kinase [Pseudohaliea sp.]|jgi:NAD+ kinase|uniref:NAD(+) kinase n=1 Tax=Pseudohaliea sp. TaxID=2740289 RepID=UPI0032EBECB7
MAAQFHRVGLVGRSRQEGLQELLDELLDLLGDRVGEVMLEDRLGAVATRDCPLLTREEIGERADLVIVLGGDGSLLSAARTMARFETPVLGINRGRLGFLTDISPDEVSELVPAVLEGRYEREERFLLDVTVEREGKVVARADALNDVVLNSGTSAQMIEFELSIDGEFVYRQRADGLIISTPTGSTAYSLSGGGPIMHPSLDAIVLVPMFPHTLSSRPIVVKGDSRIRLDVLERNRIHPPVTCDGQVNMTARPGDAVVLRKKPHRLTLLHPLGHSFYASCRDKLRWSNALVN